MNDPFEKVKNRSLTPQEKANIEMVKDYLRALVARPFDMEGVVRKYFAPDATVRWLDEMPAAEGVEAAVSVVMPLVQPGSWMEVELFDIYAFGQMVVTSRIDIIKVPGQADKALPLAGLHIIKDGKFVEYVDYLVKQ